MISESDVDDIPLLADLVNAAYRGEESKKGWTTEAFLIQGDKRTDAADLFKLLSTPDSVILNYKEHNKILGCVNLQKQGQKMYLGMFSVYPALQGRGIGKHLMAAAEKKAISWDCNTIRMYVISIRSELINWYQKQGYVHTGEIIPFPDDNKFGVPNQKLEFWVYEKKL